MNAKMICGSIGTILKKYSPEILLGLGIVGAVGSAVLACKNTLKCEDALNEHEEKMCKVEECLELASKGELEYSDEDAKLDRRVIKVQTTVEFVKIYGLPAITMAASIACLIGSHYILKQRLIATTAAFNMLNEAFTRYRERVVKEFGPEKDSELLYGKAELKQMLKKAEEEDNKMASVQEQMSQIYNENISGFARVYEKQYYDDQGRWHGSTQWTKVHDYNLNNLTYKQQKANDMLTCVGVLSVNDVYDMLGFPRTEAGMVCGWRRDPNNENKIRFKPDNMDWGWYSGADGDPILLDFNIDGVIFDYDSAKKEYNGETWRAKKPHLDAVVYSRK